MAKINILATNYQAYQAYCQQKRLSPRTSRYISDVSKAAGVTGEVLVVWGGMPTKGFDEALEHLRNTPYVTLVGL